MEAVIRYKANDGSEWPTEAACRAREKMIVDVEAAMAQLKPTPTECNWSGYVQQEAGAINRCKEMLFEIANQEGVLKWAIDGQRNRHGTTIYSFVNTVHPSWFGRMLDGDHRPLNQAYGRLCCIDAQGREWNQPYYANNPAEGLQKRVW